MRIQWKRVGAIAVALGALGALMVHAGASAGCGSSAPPTAISPSEAPTLADPGKPSAAPPEGYYFPASKAGPVYHPGKPGASPPQQAAPARP